MIRALRVFFCLLLGVLGFALAVVLAVFMILNTGTGRGFAVRKINQYAPGVTVAGLGGHFPADIKIASIAIADEKGVWLSGSELELRWEPAGLLSRTIHVTSFMAAQLAVARAPAPAAPEPQKKASTGLPNFHIALDRLAIPHLQIGAALAGQNLDLAVTGQAHLHNLVKGDASLTALAAGGQGSYQLTAAIDQNLVDLDANVTEPPDGLLGHFAGPQVHAPLTLHIALHGPRNNAALKFAAALGDAKLDGAGTLGLDPNAPHADVILNVPSLAPFASIASQNVAGNTSLHLIADGKNNAATIALNGNVTLTAAPGPAAKLVGPNGQLALLVTLANNTAAIKNLAITGAGFSITASGTVAQSGIDLHTGIALNNIALLSPGIAGAVAETGTLDGTAKDFAVHAVLAGHIAEKSLPTGPFTVTLDAQHLPQTPAGTLSAAGALEGSPLNLDASFSRDAAGLATVLVKAASWRSLNAKAALALTPGDKLPTGTANISVARLADFRAFVPLPLAGSLTADFARQNAQDFRLNLQTKNLVVTPAAGATDATLTAAGPITALLVKLNATIAKLAGDPARIAATATLDANKRSVALAALTADWRTLDIKLRGPASIETQPGLAVHNLRLGVASGSIALDGTLSPLNLRASVKDLPASLASLAAPTIQASGTLSATAALTGSTTAPAGTVTLQARDISLRAGPAAAIPPANLAASATLAGKTVNLNARLDAGPNIALNADGLVPMTPGGPIDLHLTGRADLRLLDPILAAAGTTLRGVITPDVTVSGTAAAPAADGGINLTDGSVQNIGSGLSLTKIAARITAANRLITLQSFTATAGPGSIAGHGNVDLAGPGIPIDLAIGAVNARLVSSDLITENLNAALTIKGGLRGALALGGRIDILSANINIPKSLPASVANLPIIKRGAPPPPPPPPAPDIALDLLLHAANQIFIRGDGLFAELGGHLAVTGTAGNPDPEGGFTLIRGSFALGGKTLQFTKGVVSFNGAGFIPTLDLEASNTSGNITATLTIGGTASKPTITLTSSPPLPSDEVLAYLLFGQGTQNLSAFQAAQLAAALASLAGVGGGADPLGSVRNALGLDELSLGGSGGAPSINAGRYVAPGVYVGASQSATGQGTQATVEINLYKGLKLKTATGSSGTSGGNSSSVGLTYEFNY